MANIKDSTFFWCENFFCATRNVENEEQCLQILQRHASRTEDVDREYLLSLSSANIEDYTFEFRYLPVYNLQVTARYNKIYGADDGAREITRDGWYYDEAYADCRPDFFVGGKRFEQINLPHELRYPLCAANGRGISKSEADSRAVCFATDVPRFGERRSIVKTGGEVYFVPIVMISYTYRGRKYKARINLHNSTCIAEFPPSRKAEIWAERAVKTARKLRNVCVIFSLLWVIGAAVLFLLSEPWEWYEMAFLGVSVLHLLYRLIRLPQTGYGFWLNKRLASVKGSLAALNRCRFARLFDILLTVIGLAAQAVVRFIR